jgi:teichuronic acid biosynthesis glycosyltransferase TuaC
LLEEMRVLFVSSGTSVESINSLIFDQGESLKNFGIVIEYFSIRNKGILGYLRNIVRLRFHLKNNSYDIIHAHYGLSGLVALLAKKRSSRLIISFMGTDLMGNVASSGSITVKGRFLVSINRSIADHADYVIVKSESMAAKIKVLKRSVIPNGLDLTHFQEIDKDVALKKVGWDQQFRHVLFMSDPERPEKNYLLAEKAISLLAKNDIKLHSLKHIPHEEVVYYYNASDVCLLTSYHEGSPNVIKEAMACNRPIVTTNVGDVKWLFGDIEGCYITRFQPEDVAEKIKMALEFKQKTNGRTRILELGLDTAKIAERISGVYSETLKSNI